MVAVKMDGPNLRLELTHEETQEFTDKVVPGGSGAIATALTAFGVPAFAVGVVAAALAAHAAWEVPAIKAADKGKGVFLTALLRWPSACSCRLG